MEVGSRRFQLPAKMPPGEAPLSSADCYRFMLSDPRVHVPVCGPKNDDENVGLPHEVVGTDGELLWSAEQGPFGAVTALEVETVEAPIRFQGQYDDEEIGLCYNHYRQEWIYFSPGGTGGIRI